MEHVLIFKQVLPNNSLRKCIEISLENLYSWILGLKEFKCWQPTKRPATWRFEPFTFWGNRVK